MKRFLSRIHAACLFMAVAPVLLCSATAQEPCKLTDMGTGTVASVRDGRTLLLADGRELRLAAIEATDDSRETLQSLVSKRDLQLKQLGPEVDRYGRLVAFVFADNSQQSVQQMLLEQGRARVSARIGSKACADLLLTAERAARAAHRGVWADPNFAPLRSENLDRIAAARGSIRTGGRQGLVGAGKRRHNIFEFRAALDTRLHSHHSQASSARIRYGWHRSETAGRLPDPGAGLDRTA
jgi:endonuclease YncB( thermonuclease family)